MYKRIFECGGCGNCSCGDANDAYTGNVTDFIADAVADELGLGVDPGELKLGIESELEHGDMHPDTDVIPDVNGHDDLYTTGKIAGEHLKYEDPLYYTHHQNESIRKSYKSLFEQHSFWSLFIIKNELKHAKKILDGMPYRTGDKSAQEYANVYFDREDLAVSAKEKLEKNGIKVVLYPQIQPSLF